MSNVDLVQGLYGAFAEGDVPTVVEGMDAVIQWHEAEGTRTSRAGPPGLERTQSWRTCS